MGLPVPVRLTAVRELDVRPVHRIKGRPALLRRLRGLLVAAHRFGRHRATSLEERTWSARFIDALTAAVDVAEPGTLPRTADAKAHNPSNFTGQPGQASRASKQGLSWPAERRAEVGDV